MTLETKKWDAAAFVGNEEGARIFLEEVAKEGDAQDIAGMIVTVAEALGMMQLSRSIGVSQESLFDLVNPFGGKLDHDALREVTKRLAQQLPAKKSDAA